MVVLVTAGFEQGFSKDKLIAHDQIAPLVKKQIEHYQSTYGNLHLTSVDQVIDDIAERHQIALGKVKIVHPPTPEITLAYN